MVVCCVDVCGVFVSWLANCFRESIRLFRRPQASQTSFYIILGWEGRFGGLIPISNAPMAAVVVATDRLVTVKWWFGWITYFLRKLVDYFNYVPHRWILDVSRSIFRGGAEPIAPLPTLLWIYVAAADFADRRIFSAIKYQQEIYFPYIFLFQ